MEAFQQHTGVALPLQRDNIDTDAIIPSREMRSVSKSGLAAGLFAPWRYLQADERIPNPDFPLNQSRYEGASILICLLYTSPSPRDKRQSRMPSSA